MKNAGEIIDALNYAARCLTEGRRDGGAIDFLRNARDKLRDISNLSDEYSDLYDIADDLLLRN